MSKLFNVTIITRGGTVYQGETISLIAPGEIGYVGILADHAPFATSLVPGKVILKNVSGKATTFRSAGSGFMEVLRNEAIILLDAAKPYLSR